MNWHTAREVGFVIVVAFIVLVEIVMIAYSFIRGSETVKLILDYKNHTTREIGMSAGQTLIGISGSVKLALIVCVILGIHLSFHKFI